MEYNYQTSLFWNMIKVEIVKEYELNHLIKIRFQESAQEMIVDRCALTEQKEEAISIEILEERYA